MFIKTMRRAGRQPGRLERKRKRRALGTRPVERPIAEGLTVLLAIVERRRDYVFDLRGRNLIEP
jgi:hypothetical protein